MVHKKRNYVKVLDASYNRIELVYQETFHRMRKLKQLYLNNNKIRFLQKKAFIENRYEAIWPKTALRFPDST